MRIFLLLWLNIATSLYAEGNSNLLIYNIDTNWFERFVLKHHISNDFLEEVYSDPMQSVKHAFVYALAIDSTYKTNTIDRYYEIAEKKHFGIGSVKSRYYYYDYLVRTGKFKKLNDIIKSPLYCGNKALCGYYNFIADYKVYNVCNKSFYKLAFKIRSKRALLKKLCSSVQ